MNANHFSGQKHIFDRQIIIKKMRKSILCIFLIAAIILSCSSPKDLEYRTFHNLSVESLGFNQSTISLNIEYYNPNNFGLQLRNSDLDIFINGNLLGHSSIDTLIRIPRRDTFTLPVKFAVNMQNLYKNAFSTLSGKEVMVKLSGKLSIGKANVFMIFPVNYETKETFSLF
jgi:LEA14-like dessication related protein